MVKRITLSLAALIFLATSAWADQVTANFVVPFNNTTKETMLPKDDQGQRLPMDIAALTEEKDGTIVVQLRAEQDVIDKMKTDTSTYWWLEDMVPPEEPGIVEQAGTLLKGILRRAGLLGKDEKFEPVEKPPVEPEKSNQHKANPAATQAWMSSKASIDKASVAKQKWDTQENAIESVVKLHGKTMAAYKQGGLGQAPAQPGIIDTVIKKLGF